MSTDIVLQTNGRNGAKGTNGTNEENRTNGNNNESSWDLISSSTESGKLFKDVQRNDSSFWKCYAKAKQGDFHNAKNGRS